MKKLSFITWCVSGCLSFGFVGCSKKDEKPSPAHQPQAVVTPAVATPQISPKEEDIRVPLGLDSDLAIPADNPLTSAKAELGSFLYFDKRLSKDATVSCATCHHPNKGWSDQQPVSTGFQGSKGTRNAPTVVNATYMALQFWDGRAKTLEEQSLGPIVNPVEMANTHEAMVGTLQKIAGYGPLFQRAFGTPEVTKERVAQAIASFERTLLGGNSRFDRYAAGDKTALSEAESRGRELFFGKANCTRCHVGSNFSDSDFHNLGVGMRAPNPDLGRYEVTRDEKDKGAFKTPTVRDLSRTAPYMHDGSQKTLEEVIDFYDRGGEANPYLDFRVVKLNLTAQEKADLLTFLKSLDSDPYPTMEEPVPLQ